MKPEEKKTYLEAVKEAKKLHKTANSDQRYVLETLFPELRESEDERIRKEIIAVFKGQIDFTYAKDGKKYIAWLEKQGEQKITWGEDDEDDVTILESYIRSKEWSDSHVDRALGIVERLVNKLKSLSINK